MSDTVDTSGAMPEGTESIESQETDSTQEQENTEGTQPDVKPEPPPKSNKKIYKLKVDGREYDEEVDLDDEEYLKRQLQMAKVAQKRMQEQAQLQKEVYEFIEMLRKNPRAALSNPNIGVDIKQLAREVIEEEIEQAQKSPEQIEKENLQKELEKLKSEREKERKELEEREFERLKAQEYERLDIQMTKALEQSELPKSPYVIKKMTEYMLLGLQNNINLSPEDVLPIVRDEIHSDIQSMFQVLPEEVIEQLIGKDTLGRIRKKNLAKAKTPPPVPVKAAVKDIGKSTPAPAKNEQSSQPDAQKQTFKDFFKV